MALGTVTTLTQKYLDGLGIAICDVQPTGGANYTTNGEAFDVAQVPGAKGTLLAVIPQPGSSVGGASATLMWDATNKKLKAYGTAGSASGLTEIASNTDLSAQRARVICLYTGIG
jgi:hypothetical protein